MSAPPEVRTLACHVALAHIDGLAVPLRDKILADIGDVESVRRAFQFSWTPFHKQIAILDAMRKHLAPSEWRMSQRELMRGYLDKPILRALVDTAIRIVGMSVATCARWTPRCYDAMFRNAGSVRYEAGATQNDATLLLDDFPRELFRSGSFVEALAESFEVVFELVKLPGRVVVSGIDRAAGAARYQLRCTS